MKKVNRQTVTDSINAMDSSKVEKVLKREGKATGKAEKLTSSSLSWLRYLGRRVKLAYQMLRDALSGRYPVPWTVVAALAFALLYFINPVDLVPDVLFPLGYLDDATVFAIVIATIRDELDTYIEWRELDPQDYGFDEPVPDPVNA